MNMLRQNQIIESTNVQMSQLYSELTIHQFPV